MMSPEPALRADAQRNRGHILATARALFAERGIDVPMEDIGRASGVGKGTLYRHFPTRDHLCAAVSEDIWTAVYEQAKELADADDPWDALMTWLRTFDTSIHRYRWFSARVSETLWDSGSVFGQACQAVLDQAEVLLERARTANAVSTDLSITQLLTLVAALPDGYRDSAGGSTLLPVVLRGIQAAPDELQIARDGADRRPTHPPRAR